jgi:bifunctional UDP-N-acetylglucosamine pyrophosphorylase/glucosamine-1-phosphate N-acetyltransferase
MSARAIVLAAGQGKRMKSARPKVLHPVCGRPMLWWILEALRVAGVGDVALVASADLAAALPDEPYLAGASLQVVLQEQPGGTGQAVRLALDQLAPAGGTVLVAYADMPLIDAELIGSLRAASAADAGAALALITARMPLPSNFGRIVRDGELVARIVEARDCTPAELAIDEMNAGIYAFDEAELSAVIGRIGTANAQGEYYLTDTIALLVAAGKRVVPVPATDPRAVMGVNDRVELARARTALNARLCEAHMRAGVTIVDPAATWLEAGVRIGVDSVIHPGTTIARDSVVGERCTIGPHTRLEGAELADDVSIVESVVVDSRIASQGSIGPFAHLRGGSRVGARVRIGNYVELKNAVLADDVKANHLAYIGDANVGARTNIGAGTITANFDGVRKNHTEIGADAKIGTNNSLVAPVRIGDGVVSGAGTVVIRDVPDGDRVVGNPARSIKKPQ